MPFQNKLGPVTKCIKQYLLIDSMVPVVAIIFHRAAQVQSHSKTRGSEWAGQAVTMEFVKLFLFPLLLLTLAKAEETEFKMEVTEKPPEDCERKSQDGDYLSVHYTGSLATNGEKFDSSRDRDQPFSFTLGRREAIQGYEKGLQDMCVGEKRKLVVPPEMGE